MVQSGIAYAAGQLLAVVAPRTVLVVDAPTDWSLAGPLWELALDDAPVDEILDVLIRRGIRTAPSFAIVRVENDAVRALVRGSVPVCFERVGEPVRLDATGATTWLEGLISSARRVLVGAVETNSTLPYLVSTGVVLVSGLALPCGPTESTDRGVITPGISEPGEPGGPGAAPEESTYFSRPAPAPVGSGGYTSSAGREPRVVDLTRSGARAPAKAAYTPTPEPHDSWALASARSGSDTGGRQRNDLNGHSPSSLEAAPAEPAAQSAAPQSAESLRSEPIDFTALSADDPGELQDLGPEHSRFEAAGSAPAPAPGRPVSDPYSTTESYASLPPADQADLVAEPAPPSAAVVETPDSLDDLLRDPADTEEPPTPSPADLPNLDPPSLSLPMGAALNGFGVPVQPRGFGGAPAAWPPAAPDPEVDDVRNDSADLHEPAADVNGESHSDRNADQADQVSSAFLPPPAAPDAQPPALGELPLRVRGRSLRPEQQRPMNGNRLLGGPEIEPIIASPSVPAAADDRFAPPPSSPSPSPEASPAPGEGSDGLLLPAFFRGSRAARQPDVADPAGDAPYQQDDENESAAPASWLSDSQKPAPPVAWVAPVRRGQPEEHSGFNGGPPAMPGALRPVPSDFGVPPVEEQPLDDYAEEPTEVTPGPGPTTPAEGIASDSSPEPLREPPRLLGVWCDAGHVTSPDHEECRVCGLAVPPQAPILVARPPLGVLIFDNGDQVMVDRPVVLGRDPKPVASPDPETPVLHPVPSATGQVSRTHAEVRAEGWDVVLTDLDAMNGTALTLPGASPVAIEPGVATLITPGTRVDLGGESGFVFEVEA